MEISESLLQSRVSSTNQTDISVTVRYGFQVAAVRMEHMLNHSLQNCRKFSGCVAANNLVIDQKDVAIEDPSRRLKTYRDSNTGSGGTARRSFCSNCGRWEARVDVVGSDADLFDSPICAVPTDSDEQYVLSLGIFPRIPQPAFELFAGHRHAWLPAIPNATQYRFMTSDGILDESSR